MTNLKILQNVIEKAKRNGLKRFRFWDFDFVKDGTYRVEYVLSHKGLVIICKEDSGNNSHGWDTFVSLESIIFSHDFAKAFWGEKAPEQQIMEYHELMNNEHGITRWKYHLQQMVLKDEPLKYLEKFI